MRVAVNKTLGVVDCEAWFQLRMSFLTSLLFTSQLGTFSIFEFFYQESMENDSWTQETLRGESKIIHEYHFLA